MVANSRFAVAVHTAATLAYRQARGAGYVSSEQLAASVRTNRLARSPRRIPLLEIYRAVEDDGSVLAYNPNPPNRSCPVSCGIKGALAPVFGAVQDAVTHTLGKATLADVLDRI